MGDLPDLRRVPVRAPEKRHARGIAAAHRRPKQGTLPELRDPDAERRQKRDVTGATSQHNGTSMLVGDNWIGEEVLGDRERTGRALDDDLHLLRRLRLLLRPRDATGRARHQAAARDREPVREGRLHRPQRRDQLVDPRLRGERARRGAGERTGRHRVRLPRSFDYTQTPTPATPFQSAPVPRTSRHLPEPPADDT